MLDLDNKNQTPEIGLELRTAIAAKSIGEIHSLLDLQSSIRDSAAAELELARCTARSSDEHLAEFKRGPAPLEGPVAADPGGLQ